MLCKEDMHHPRKILVGCAAKVIPHDQDHRNQHNDLTPRFPSPLVPRLLRFQCRVAAMIMVMDTKLGFGLVALDLECIHDTISKSAMDALKIQRHQVEAQLASIKSGLRLDAATHREAKSVILT